MGQICPLTCGEVDNIPCCPINMGCVCVCLFLLALSLSLSLSLSRSLALSLSLFPSLYVSLSSSDSLFCVPLLLSLFFCGVARSVVVLLFVWGVFWSLSLYCSPIFAIAHFLSVQHVVCWIFRRAHMSWDMTCAPSRNS